MVLVRDYVNDYLTYEFDADITLDCNDYFGHKYFVNENDDDTDLYIVNLSTTNSGKLAFEI